MRLSLGLERIGTRGAGRVVLSLGALMALVMIPASAVTNLTGEYTYTTSSDSLAIYAVNNNTASGASGLQANSNAPGGKGVYGYSNASGAPGFGVAGISQNGYGVYGSSYGTGITAIYGENLSGGGIGMQGSSSGGTGVYGVGAQYGLQGQSNSTSGTYAGVMGMDNSSGSGGAYGVFGESKSSHTAMYAYATGSGTGLYAYSGSGDAMVASTPGIGGIALLGAPAGEGAVLEGFSGNATDPAVKVVSEGNATDNIGGYNSAGERFVVQGHSANASGETLGGTADTAMDVQISGDVFVYGRVYTDCTSFPASSASSCIEGPYARTRTSSTGAKLQMYGAEQSTATVEDFGEARIVNGQGYVALEQTFASSISRTRPYLVFITPEGDSHGLYVTAKSLSGFTVHESAAGRSSIAFQYRIVAQPFGDSGARMAVVTPKRGTALASTRPLEGYGVKPQLLPIPAAGARVTRPPHFAMYNLHRH